MVFWPHFAIMTSRGTMKLKTMPYRARAKASRLSAACDCSAEYGVCWRHANVNVSYSCWCCWEMLGVASRLLKKRIVQMIKCCWESLCENETWKKNQIESPSYSKMIIHPHRPKIQASSEMIHGYPGILYSNGMYIPPCEVRKIIAQKCRKNMKKYEKNPFKKIGQTSQQFHENHKNHDENGKKNNFKMHLYASPIIQDCDFSIVIHPRNLT